VHRGLADTELVRHLDQDLLAFAKLLEYFDGD